MVLVEAKVEDDGWLTAEEVARPAVEETPAMDEGTTVEARMVGNEVEGAFESPPLVVGTTNADEDVDNDKPRDESCALVELGDSIGEDDGSETGVVLGTAVA